MRRKATYLFLLAAISIIIVLATLSLPKTINDPNQLNNISCGYPLPFFAYTSYRSLSDHAETKGCLSWVGNPMETPKTFLKQAFFVNFMIVFGVLGGSIYLIRKRSLKITGIVLLSFLIIVFIERSPMIFQEGNPLPMAYAILKLSTTDKGYAKIDDRKYITKRGENNIKSLNEYLASHNLVPMDTMGSAHTYKDKNNKQYFANVKMYSSQFMIWDFSGSVKQGLTLP
jgi:hypothetical protein